MIARLAIASLFSLALLAGAEAARAETATAVNAEVGRVTYTKTDTQVPLSGSAQVMGIEYCHFYRLDRCYFFGYRQAVDATAQRNYYLAAYGGFRYYPRHVGFPVDDVVGESHVHFDETFKPYIDGSVALGRALYNTVAQTGDLSADILGLNLGVGLTWHPVGRWILDTGIKYEQYQQNGGGTNSLALSGTNLYILLGSGFLF